MLLSSLKTGNFCIDNVLEAVRYMSRGANNFVKAGRSGSDTCSGCVDNQVVANSLIGETRRIETVGEASSVTQPVLILSVIVTTTLVIGGVGVLSFIVYYERRKKR